MGSLVYFFAKFTEEFILLFAAVAFALLAAYLYFWVIRRRRLGSARDLVPGNLVREYLNQLIGEAQFVRTQLFGLLNGNADGTAITAEGLSELLRNATRGGVSGHDLGVGGGAGVINPSESQSVAGGSAVPQDLLERLSALQTQLNEKESMIININVEKKKLSDEINTLKEDKTALATSGAGNNDDLLKRLKELESRLEEYAIIEEDLANLKKLQQENQTLKTQLESGGAGTIPREPTRPSTQASAELAPVTDEPGASTGTESGPSVSLEPNSTQVGAQGALDQDAGPAGVQSKNNSVNDVPKSTPHLKAVAEQKISEPAPKKPDDDLSSLALDQAAIDALLMGESAIPPMQPETETPSPAPSPLATEPAHDAQIEQILGSVVDESLETKSESAPTPGPETATASSPNAPAQAPSPMPTPTPSAPKPSPEPVKSAPKSDDELLKEFENLLNS